MVWPINPALDALNDAAFTFCELHGLDAMMNWLGHETQRLRAHRSTILARRAEAAQPQAEAAGIDPEHEKTLAVLDFYADPKNYRTAKRKPVADVMEDGGARARARIEEIEGRDEPDGEGGE